MNVGQGIIERCFICYKNNKKSATGRSDSSTITQEGDNDEEKLQRKQLLVVFLLEKFFNIPKETFCQFEEQYGNPSSWIYWCDSCSVLVEDAKKLFDQVALLERKINLLKQNVENKISSSAKCEQYSGQENNVKVKNEPTEIVRTLIMQDALYDIEVKMETDDNEYLFLDNESVGDVSNAGEMFEEDNNDYELEDSCDVTEQKVEEKYSGKIKTAETKRVVKKHQLKKDCQIFVEKNSPLPLPKYPNFKDNFESCPLCSKTFSKRHESYNHLLTHPPPCPYCSKQLLNSDEFQSHVTTHRNESITFSKCCVCYKDFKNFVSVLSHKCCRVICDVTQNPTPKERSESPSSSNSSLELPYECSICDKKFTKKIDFTNHNKTHTNTKNLSCSDCGKTFSSNYILQKHKLVHKDPDGKPFKCSTCGKGFAYERSLRDHENIHKEDNPFRCTICGKNFPSSYFLFSHMNTHTQDKDGNIERPFMCTTCEKSYTTLINLRNHEKLHTAEKTHACQFCGKKFVLKHNKKEHERIHTGEKRYACTFCPERFAQRPTWKRHMRTHTGEPPPLQCSFCDKRFVEKKNLDSHERKHTGEKPYSCTICGKSFKDAGYRTRHVRKVHEKVPGPHPCPVCEERFYNKIDLKRHEKVHL